MVFDDRSPENDSIVIQGKSFSSFDAAVDWFQACWNEVEFFSDSTESRSIRVQECAAALRDCRAKLEWCISTTNQNSYRDLKVKTDELKTILHTVSNVGQLKDRDGGVHYLPWDTITANALQELQQDIELVTQSPVRCATVVCSIAEDFLSRELGDNS